MEIKKRGGPRTGAGRKPGVANKASIARQAEVAAGGMTPLEYMLKVMRDPTAEHPRRQAMAVAAAPYVHPKLASTEITGKDGGPVVIETIERLIVEVADQNGEGV
jgi:hypothetical protein